MKTSVTIAKLFTLFVITISRTPHRQNEQTQTKHSDPVYPAVYVSY